jgi:hypothetical protein
VDEHTQKLQSYIQEQLSTGQSPDVIAAQLHEAGWPDESIKAALNHTAARLSAPEDRHHIYPDRSTTIADYAQEQSDHSPTNLSQSPQLSTADPRQPEIELSPSMALQTPSDQSAPQPISTNPFTYISMGLKNSLRINPLALSIVLVLFVVVNFIATTMMGGTLMSLVFVIGMGGAPKNWVTISVITGSILAVYLLTILYIMLALTRLAQAADLRENITAWRVFEAAFKRYWLALRTYVLVVASFVATNLLIEVVGRVNTILSALLSIVLIIGIILIAFRLIYINFAILDTDRPTGAIDALRRSSRAWERSPLATFILALTLGTLVFVVALFLQSLSSAIHLKYVSSFIFDIIASYFLLVALASLSSLYARSSGPTPLRATTAASPASREIPAG